MVKKGIPIEIGRIGSKPLSCSFLHFLQWPSFANILHLWSMPLHCHGLHQAGSRMAGDRRWWWGFSPAGWTSNPDLTKNDMKKTKEIKKIGQTYLWVIDIFWTGSTKAWVPIGLKTKKLVAINYQPTEFLPDCSDQSGRKRGSSACCLVLQACGKPWVRREQ